MAECPNCGTEVRPEWSLCPRCKVNMRTFTGQPQGLPPRQSPAPTPSAPPEQAAAQAEPAPAKIAPAKTAATGPTCPHCGAAVPAVSSQYCPQCGEPLAETTAMARVRRLLSSPYLVGALGVVFVLLVAAALLSGSGGSDGGGPAVQAANVGQLPSPTVTVSAAVSRTPPVTVPPGGRATANGTGNVTGNVTPYVPETVAVIKTLDRYIQNAGGDPGSQLKDPAPATPATPLPVGSVPGQTGPLSWSGEGSYVTDPFVLQAGVVRVDLAAGVLTMAQMRDQTGAAIGIATAGPEAGSTMIRVPAPGTYRLEVWPFGPGTWTVAVTYPLTPTTVPTLAPVVVTTAVPTAANTSEAPTTVETTIAPTETPIPTATPTPMPTQESHTFNGGAGTVALPITLNQGLALFTYSSTANGTFSLSLVGSGETVLVPSTEGPLEGSKAVALPATGPYFLNVVAPGEWTVSIS